MSDNCDKSRNRGPEEAVSPTPDGAFTFYIYDSEGRRVGENSLEADPAIILFKDGMPASDPLGSSGSCEFIDGQPSATAPFWSGRYAWARRELDVEIALKFNRAGRCCDPTQGQYLEEDVAPS